MENKLSGPILNAVIKQIKKGLISDAELKSFFENGKLNAQELINQGVLTQEKYDALYPPLTPSQIQEARKQAARQKLSEGTATDDDIVNYVFEGLFTQAELVKAGFITSSKKRQLFPEEVKVEFGSWKDVPPLAANRVDVFVLGIAGSGKTCVMAGLLAYGTLNGRLQNLIENRTGYEYVNTLVDAVERGGFPPATSVDYVQHMACDFKDEKKNSHPLTFIEMSGELFEKSHLAKKEDMPARFKEYLFDSNNTKVIFLAIDYIFDRDGGGSQRRHFDFILQFLEENGTMDKLEQIVLVITKWDEAEDQSDNHASEFLGKKYRSLIELCKQYKEKYQIEFRTFKFSLGEIKRRSSDNEAIGYQYDESYSKLLFNLLCRTSIDEGKKSPKPKGIFRKLFG